MYTYMHSDTDVGFVWGREPRGSYGDPSPPQQIVLCVHRVYDLKAATSRLKSCNFKMIKVLFVDNSIKRNLSCRRFNYNVDARRVVGEL